MPAFTVPPASEIELLVAFVVSVPVLHAVEVALPTVNPVGSVSLKATPVSATVLPAGFVMVSVSDDVPLTGIVTGTNTFAIEGGATTLTLAEAVPPVPPSVEVIALVVLFCCPAAVPVTFTENVHEPVAASEAPERLSAPVPCVAVIVPPPHEPASPLGVEMTKPAGRVSLNEIPSNVVAELLFCTLKLRLVLPFSGMLVAPKTLLRTGGPTTVTLAFEVLPVPPLVELT